MRASGITRWKLLSPFIFLRLKFGERKRYGILAIGCGLFCSIIYYILPNRPSLVGEGGIFIDLQLLVTFLFPFYVASLVAVATFQRSSLDDLPTGGQVELIRKNEATVKLTRRNFICFIFSYCAILSLLIFLIVMTTKFLSDFVKHEFSEYIIIISSLGVFICFTVFSHLIIITLWGYTI